MSQQQKIKIMGDYAVAIPQGQFSQQNDGPLAETTVVDTLNLVATTFRRMDATTQKRTPRIILEDFYDGN
jgi:hypothetical protein